MTTSQKAVLSLLISVLLFGCFAVLAFTGLFDLTEAPFFYPGIGALRIILLISFFLTVYLTVFLLFNFRQDPITIIQNRLKQLRISLIEQFCERDDEMDFKQWSKVLERNREEIKAQLKQGIKIASNNARGEIDAIIDKSLDELLQAIGGRSPLADGDSGFDEKKLTAILNRILAALTKAAAPAHAPTQPPASPAPSSQSPNSKAASKKTGGQSLLKRAMAIVENIKEAEPLEELEVLEELEEFEELEELEELESPVYDEIATEEPSSGTPRPVASREELEKLTSEIEFASIPEEEGAGDEAIDKDLEIVSPFSTMVFDFSDSANDDEAPNIPAPADSLAEELLVPISEEEGDETQNQGQYTDLKDDMTAQLSLIHKPFTSTTSSAKIETMESLPDLDYEPDIVEYEDIEPGGIIEERNGVPYISGNALSPGPEAAAALNQDLKNLADSIIEKH